MIQHFSVTFFAFAMQIFPLQLRHQTSAAKLRLSQGTLES